MRRVALLRHDAARMRLCALLRSAATARLWWYCVCTSCDEAADRAARQRSTMPFCSSAHVHRRDLLAGVVAILHVSRRSPGAPRGAPGSPESSRCRRRATPSGLRFEPRIRLPQALRVAIERALRSPTDSAPKVVGCACTPLRVAGHDGARMLRRHREQRCARRIHRIQQVERSLAQHDPPGSGQDVLAAASRMHARRIRTDVGNEERLVGEVVPWALRAGLFAIGDDLRETLSDLHAQRLRDDPLLERPFQGATARGAQANRIRGMESASDLRSTLALDRQQHETHNWNGHCSARDRVTGIGTDDVSLPRPGQNDLLGQAVPQR